MKRLTIVVTVIAFLAAAALLVITRAVFGPEERQGPSTGPPATLDFTVTTQLDRVQFTNDGQDTWTRCSVEIAGGYLGIVDERITPGQSGYVEYAGLMRDGRSVPTGEGMVRARKGIDLRCTRADGKIASDTYRAK